MNGPSPTFDEVCAAESVTADERAHLMALLKKLRERNQPYTGTPYRSVSYREILTTLREDAYKLERDAQRYDAEAISERAEIYDATANLVLALLINHSQIEPILRRHGQRMGTARQ